MASLSPSPITIQQITLQSPSYAIYQFNRTRSVIIIWQTEFHVLSMGACDRQIPRNVLIDNGKRNATKTISQNNDRFQKWNSNWHIIHALSLHLVTRNSCIILEFRWQRFWFTVLVSINSNRNHSEIINNNNSFVTLFNFQWHIWIVAARMTKGIKDSNRQQVVIVRWLFVCYFNSGRLNWIFSVERMSFEWER